MKTGLPSGSTTMKLAGPVLSASPHRTDSSCGESDGLVLWRALVGFVRELEPMRLETALVLAHVRYGGSVLWRIGELPATAALLGVVIVTVKLNPNPIVTRSFAG